MKQAMRWVKADKKLPEIDLSDCPKEYLVRVKGDDPRSGWVFCGYVTAKKMRDIEDYFEWLKE